MCTFVSSTALGFSIHYRFGFPLNTEVSSLQGLILWPIWFSVFPLSPKSSAALTTNLLHWPSSKRYHTIQMGANSIYYTALHRSWKGTKFYSQTWWGPWPDFHPLDPPLCTHIRVTTKDAFMGSLPRSSPAWVEQKYRSRKSNLGNVPAVKSCILQSIQTK